MNKKQDLTFAVHTRQQIHFLSVDFVVDFQITKKKRYVEAADHI